MANWSVILNVLLLAGVMLAIFRLIQTKRQVNSSKRRREPSFSNLKDFVPDDDIIAVRRVESVEPLENEPAQSLGSHTEEADSPRTEASTPDSSDTLASSDTSPVSVHVFLLAKEDRQLAGYELLQTLLAAGLRFGEGQLFHRHQHKNGQGPIICSLATATADGTFDLQNIGAFTARGLCLFMEASGNSSIDAERLSIMVETAKQLAEGLDTYLLDDSRNPWSDECLKHYHKQLKITEEAAIV